MLSTYATLPAPHNRSKGDTTECPPLATRAVRSTATAQEPGASGEQREQRTTLHYRPPGRSEQNATSPQAEVDADPGGCEGQGPRCAP